VLRRRRELGCTQLAGILLAIPLVVALTFVAWAWPRVIGRVKADLADVRRARKEQHRVHS
jgi:hypothetical protein